VQRVIQSLHDAKIRFQVFDRVEVEPTDASFKEAIEFARQGGFDGYIAVGGGSVMDTAKAANLYATYPPDDFLDYVNPPIGKGKPVPGPLKPLIAIPTTVSFKHSDSSHEIHIEFHMEHMCINIYYIGALIECWIPNIYVSNSEPSMSSSVGRNRLRNHGRCDI
jgi:hypothetical protein